VQLIAEHRVLPLWETTRRSSARLDNGQEDGNIYVDRRWHMRDLPSDIDADVVIEISRLLMRGSRAFAGRRTGQTDSYDTADPPFRSSNRRTGRRDGVATWVAHGLRQA
jgi:hypothetical protein